MPTKAEIREQWKADILAEYPNIAQIAHTLDIMFDVYDADPEAFKRSMREAERKDKKIDKKKDAVVDVPKVKEYEGAITKEIPSIPVGHQSTDTANFISEATKTDYEVGSDGMIKMV